MKKNFLNQMMVFIGFIFLIEIIYKVLVYHTFFSSSLIYTLLFSLPFTFLFMLIKVFKRKVNMILFYVIELLITIYFAFQYCFHMFFATPFSFATLGLAGQAFDWGENIKNLIIGNWWQIILIFIPFVITIALVKFINFDKYRLKKTLVLFGLFFLSYGISILSLFINKKPIYSAYNLYFNINSVIDNYKEFGVLCATRLDLERLTFNFQEKIITDNNFDMITNKNTSDPTKEEVVYEANIIDIDFDKLISETKDKNLVNIHNYFKNRQPTLQNQYTGMFKGKNLIFVLAEAFNEIAVSPELTPTLYNMIHTGFEFNNFYSPVYLSTIGGEFQAGTGSIPSQETLTTWKEKMVKNPYALGNSFTGLGYQVQSYHDWTYTYYGRQKYMKNMGYLNYKGCGNGLETIFSNTRNGRCQWLPRDVELIEGTVNDYINSEVPFLTYYVTVSGHAPFNFTGGNSTSLRYKSLVNELGYSANVKAYIASQIELDRAMKLLIDKLTIAGKLDDTVIVLVGDHYPYTLTTEEVNEAAAYKKDGVVEINRSNLIIWNNAMQEKIVVNKVGSQIDVLPTVLNLFGVTYDSRLIIGRDILSNSEGLAIMSNRSWVSDYGTYFANQRKFVAREGVEVPSDYVSNVNGLVSNYFTMSKYLITYNYHERVLGEK